MIHEINEKYVGTPEYALSRLSQSVRSAERINDQIRSWVFSAKDRGASWEQIGDALGMTKQSAWERYATDYQEARSA